MTDVTPYFIPDQRQDLPPLPTDATPEQMRERVDLLASIINRILPELLGDDGEQHTPPSEAARGQQ